MEKIISLFERNFDTDNKVRDEIVSGAEWVVNGEGMATRKMDGTCCMMRNGKLFKRYTVKGKRVVPANFKPTGDPDPNTGKQTGWVPVGDGPEDKYYREALRGPYQDGTYELLGPRIQGDAESVGIYLLSKHGEHCFFGDNGCVDNADIPRDFEGIKTFLSIHNVEGIVWHHPDGRMVKIKGKDFGIERKG